MKLFIKKKKGKLTEQEFVKKQMGYFSDALENKKVIFAQWLNKKSEGYSIKQKRLGLIIFCLTFSCVFILGLGRSIHSHQFNYRTVILRPRSVKSDQIPTLLYDSLRKKIIKTREWLDSLKKTDTARFHAILLSKPNMLKNLNIIEQFYQLQSK